MSRQGNAIQRGKTGEHAWAQFLTDRGIPATRHVRHNYSESAPDLDLQVDPGTAHDTKVLGKAALVTLFKEVEQKYVRPGKPWSRLIMPVRLKGTKKFTCLVDGEFLVEMYRAWLRQEGLLPGTLPSPISQATIEDSRP